MESQYKYSTDVQDEVIRLREKAIARGDGWASIYKAFPDIAKSTLKDMYYRWCARGNPPVPIIKSAFSEGDVVDEEEVWRLIRQHEALGT